MPAAVTTTTQRTAAVVPGSGPSVPYKKPPSNRTVIKIDDFWYDLTQWKNTHPGGAPILEHLNGQDATDAFYCLHSKDAIARLNRLNHSSTPPAGYSEISSHPIDLSFRAFRQKLEKDGWFERELKWELFYFFSVYLSAAFGTYLAWTGHPWWAVFVLGVCMQQAGWIGHDYNHGRGGPFYTWTGRILAGTINAFSPMWWSNKHNTHHVYTNHIGIDTDVDNDPVFHLFIPSPEHDVWFRKYQHVYFVPVAAFLYVSWRIQSLQRAYREMDLVELSFMAINYLWLYSLGFPVAFGSVYVGGLLVAVVVTATHQSEEMITNTEITDYSFVQTQFDTTRDAKCPDFVAEWLWGGMQYQLEHHLFPFMPKYKYASLRPLVQQWAAENKIEYRMDDMWPILRRNINTLRYYAQPVGNGVQPTAWGKHKPQ